MTNAQIFKYCQNCTEEGKLTKKS